MAGLYSILFQLLSLYELLLFIWVILGWLQMFGALPYSRPLHTFMGILYRLVDPALRIVRGILPTMGGIDLSPLLVFLAIEFLKWLLAQILL